MSELQDKIIQKAIEVLKTNSQGVRSSELINKIKELLPDVNFDTIRGTVWDLNKRKPNDVYRPTRGLFRHISFRGEEIPDVKSTEKPIFKEQEFYDSFAKYLVSELGDCSKAMSLGGSKFKHKWGTPDVIGTYKDEPADRFKGELEIVSAEIKTDIAELITAFGQACAYILFSHKAYIVVPESSPKEDIDKIESLCMIFGIGLILFDVNNKEISSFKIKTRPIKHSPDAFYINEYLSFLTKDQLNYLLS